MVLPFNLRRSLITFPLSFSLKNLTRIVGGGAGWLPPGGRPFIGRGCAATMSSYLKFKFKLFLKKFSTELVTSFLSDT